ncbi:MAG TPA: cysteine dioxygenase family protein [Allosphingosinicella sp.]|nr:cysteine dioxygenase family protein [Allosphingosinicella sp.]
MADAHGDFLALPARVLLGAAEPGQEHEPRQARLPVKGQGTIAFAIAQRSRFTVTLRADCWGAPGFRWSVEFGAATLSEFREGHWCVLEPKEAGADWMPVLGLDPDPLCPYWFSLDCHNRLLRYGKGEMRLETMLMEHYLGPKPADGAPDPYGWLCEVGEVELRAEIRGEAEIWRDPVTYATPMKVVDPDMITMDDVARETDRVAVPANLTPACQQLYQNVAGKAFVLDGPDFPEFSQAIKRSIETRGLWCHDKLEEKASEFGEKNELATYLRITLGGNQGESPGIPFVMEIWPHKHYSPIHDHGGADAVIKVLHGAINVHLYPMLSRHHEQPYGTAVFRTGEVTWISSRLNQIHKLENLDPEPCITIQCYQYAATNDLHWPYFDYLQKWDVARFDPNSDADYLWFKEKMKEEWYARGALGVG